MTAALASGPLQRQQVGQRPTDREATAHDDDVQTGDGDVVVLEQHLDAGGVQASGASTPWHELAEVHRVQAVDVLVRIDRQQRRLVVEVRRERVLDEEGVDAGIGVEAATTSSILLGGVGREVAWWPR